MKEILIIIINAIFIENFVLSKFLGICPFLGVSKNLDSAVGMSGAVIFVMVCSSAITHAVNTYLLVPNGLEYLQTIIFILIIATFVQLVEMILKKYMPSLHSALGVYLPLITTNCAVLGVAVLNVDKGFTLVEAVINSFGAGVGFMVALLMFAGVRTRLEDSKIPEAFKGLPITLIAASLVSLSFMGFAGVVEGLFR
ncbi:MAG: RnfABCDGE type electron transport complex subunit A [Clostridia bacterium]|nr:RnfABCDGE type electron transport complex subunit A [Clostridia bacterium]